MTYSPGVARPAKTVPFIKELVRSSATDECVLWPFSRDSDGYPRMGVAGWPRLAHQGVCALAHGPRPEASQCRHSCNTPPCVNPRHLSWSTAKENQSDRVANGTHTRREKNGRAVLSGAAARRIRRDYAASRMNQRELAERYGVSQAHISRIIKEQAWR